MADDLDVTGFICRQRPLPKTVIVQDFNYRQANLENLKATETVSDTGRGEVMFYGDNLRTNEEAKALAKVRAQELPSRGQIFLGDATAIGLRSGYFLELTEHYRDSFNAKYLITEVQHSGSQAGVLLAGAATPYAGSRNGMNFPLPKGAEVLLSFIGGDPDQPVIMAAVPNSENPNVVTSDNLYLSGSMTPSGNKLTFSDVLAQYTSLALSLAAFMYVVLDRFKPRSITPASALNVSTGGNFLGAIDPLSSSYLKQTPDYIELKTGSAPVGLLPLWEVNSNLVGGINHAVANYRVKLKLDDGNLGISAIHGVKIDKPSFVVNVPPLFPPDPAPPVQNRAIVLSYNETALKSDPIGTSSLTLKDASVELLSTTSGLDIRPLEFTLATIGSHISGAATKLGLVGPTVVVRAADINPGGSINIKLGLMTAGDITCLGAGAAGVGFFAQAAAQNATTAASHAQVLALLAAQVAIATAVVTAQAAVETLKQVTEQAVLGLEEGRNILAGNL